MFVFSNKKPPSVIVNEVDCDVDDGRTSRDIVVKSLNEFD